MMGNSASYSVQHKNNEETDYSGYFTSCGDEFCSGKQLHMDTHFEVEQDNGGDTFEEESDRENSIQLLMKEDDQVSENLDWSVPSTPSASLDLESTYLRIFDDFLCLNNQHPLDDVTALTAIPTLLKLLQEDHRSDIQCRLFKLLTKLMRTSEQSKKCIVEAGACPIFIKLLESDSNKVAASATWALKLITDDQKLFRRMVIEQGIVPRLILLISQDVPEDVMFKSRVFSCVYNLLGHDHWSSQALTTICLPEIRESLMKPYNNVMYDACLLLRRLIFTGSVTVYELVELRIVHRLVEVVNTLNDDTYGSLRGALYAIEAISIFQSQAAMDHCTLPALLRLLVLNDHLRIRADTVVLIIRIFRYIVTGNKERLHIVLKRGWLARIINILQTGNPDVQKEAALAIFDLSRTCNNHEVALRLQQDVLPGLADLLIFFQGSKVADVAGQVLVRFLVNISSVVTTAEQRIALRCFITELNLQEQLEEMKQHGDVLTSCMAAACIDKMLL